VHHSRALTSLSTYDADPAILNNYGCGGLTTTVEMRPVPVSSSDPKGATGGDGLLEGLLMRCRSW
jgi:hypothetical protein